MKPYQLSAALIGTLGGSIPARFVKKSRFGKVRRFFTPSTIIQKMNSSYQDFPSRQMMRAALRASHYMEVKAEFDIPRKARRGIAREKAKAEFKKYRGIT